MKTYLVLLPVLMFSFLFLQGCGEKIPVKPLKGKEISLSDVYKNENGSKLEFKLNYFQFDDPKGGNLYKSVNDSITNFILTNVNYDEIRVSSVDKLFEFLKNDFIETLDYNEGSVLERYFSGTTSQVLDSQGVVSVSMEITTSFDMAPTGVMVSYFSFDKATGYILKINDVIDSSKNAEFLKISEKHFNEATKKYEYTMSPFYEGVFFNAPVFLIGNNGLYFCFNSFEVLDERKFEYIIPFNELKGLVKKGSVLERFVK